MSDKKTPLAKVTPGPFPPLRIEDLKEENGFATRTDVRFDFILGGHSSSFTVDANKRVAKLNAPIQITWKDLKNLVSKAGGDQVEFEGSTKKISEGDGGPNLEQGDVYFKLEAFFIQLGNAAVGNKPAVPATILVEMSVGIAGNDEAAQKKFMNSKVDGLGDVFVPQRLAVRYVRCSTDEARQKLLIDYTKDLAANTLRLRD